LRLRRDDSEPQKLTVMLPTDEVVCPSGGMVGPKHRRGRPGYSWVAAEDPLRSTALHGAWLSAWRRLG
jgi:hypothetical protein